ncbi:MAG: signal peptidase II [Steroidobacteraceae bacterium]
MSRGWRWLWVAALVILLDQLSKAWIARHIALDQGVVLLPVLSFTLRGNPGAAFSMLADASGWQRWFFSAIAVVLSVAILVYLYRIDGRKQRPLAVALSLVLGGAIGNLIDRLRLGQVIDFVVVHWKDAYFPAFNIADSAITVGAILYLLDALILEPMRSRRSG